MRMCYLGHGKLSVIVKKYYLAKLRLQYIFRLIIFFKTGFLGQNIGRSMIFNVLKKLLKKAKYWRRNHGFTLIDSNMMLRAIHRDGVREG